MGEAGQRRSPPGLVAGGGFIAAAFSMDDLPPIELPIEGVLDLHTFRPSQVKDLVATYLDACSRRGLRRVRIIHGKGTGALRQTVHALLRQRPEVTAFYLAGATSGEWGATWVELCPDPKPPTP